MKKLLALMALILFISSLLASFVEGNILFQSDILITVTGYNSGVVVTDRAWFNDIADEYLISALDTLYTIPTGELAGYYYFAEFDKSLTIEDLIDDLEKEINIVYAEPNHEMQLLGIISNDTPYNSTSWGLERIGMNQVWTNNLAFGNHVKVAVLDTGIDLGIDPYGIHPDLCSNLWDDGNGVHGHNVLGDIGSPNENVNIPQDNVGHGTHVAGIIGASTNNGIGVAGVAGGWGPSTPGCTIMPVRIGGSQLSALTAVMGITWAINHGAEVINMSLEMVEGTDHTLRNRIQSIMDHCPSVVFVAAAGNDGTNKDCFPANISGVISVAATGPTDARTDYSNFGTVDICAPGGIGQIGEVTGIISTTPQDDGFTNHTPTDGQCPWDCNYEYVSGTSMAAPMVSGAVALLKDRFPGITREQIIQRLQGTADDITQMNSNPIYMTTLGTGRLNVYRALTEEYHPTYRLDAVSVADGNDEILTTGENEVGLNITLKNWWVDGSEDVVGILSTDDPYITINWNEGTWDSMDHLATGVSNSFVISDSSPYPRNIKFALQLTYENIEETEYFELPCYPNLESMYSSDAVSVTSEIAVFDMDNDGVDEIAFGLKRQSIGGLRYFACLYNNSQLSMVAVNDSIEAKPTFGDLEYGGEKEVVFVTNQVTVYAFDSALQNINHFPYTYGVSGRIKSVVIEDLTFNGQMDIIANGNDHATDRGFYIMMLQYEYPNTNFDEQIYRLNEGEQFLSELAVGNVDNDLTREFLAVKKNRGNWVGIDKRHITGVAKGAFQVDGGSCWVIDPGINSINKLGSTNLLLIKPQFTSPDAPVYHHRLFFGIATKFEPGIPRATSYSTYCYDFSESNTVANMVWCHTDDSLTPSNQTSPTDTDPGKIIAGDFYPSNFGIELLTTASEEVIDIETGLRIKHLTNDYCPINGGYYHRNRRPALIADIGATATQDVIISRNNQLSAYHAGENPIQSFSKNFSANIKSLAIGSAVYNDVRDLYILVGYEDSLGVALYRIPIKKNINSGSDEWTQFQNNERSSAQYLSHIPSLITNDMTIRQDAVINVDTDIEFGVELTVNPGIELRVRNGSIVKNRGSLFFIGEESHPIVVKGMCPTKIQDHWLGVSSGNNSVLTLQDTYLSNATIGLDVYENGYFSITNSTIQHNEVSVEAYNSLVDFGHDKIQCTQSGLASYHGAVPYLAWNDTGQNIVAENEYGIYALQSLPYLEEGLNNFCDNARLNIKTDAADGIKAQQNWWGYTDENLIRDTFSDYHNVIYSNWLMAPNGNAGKHCSNEPFDLAENARMNQDWSVAIQYYYQVLNDSLINSDDYQSLKGSTICHSRINQVPSYIDWLDDKIAAYQYDDEFSKELRNTKALCSRLIGDYQNAIDYYSDILDSSPAIVDSCFALIDMGFTWLESGGNLRNKYAALMPKTTKDQILNARKMLDNLRNPNETHEYVVPLRPVLYNNYPNPFNPSTTIEYSIPQTGRIKLSIYNIRGQKVKTLLDCDIERGQHRVVWDGRDDGNRGVASGVYFIRLVAAGGTSIRKAILLK